jgi:hypothetical protein
MSLDALLAGRSVDWSEPHPAATRTSAEPRSRRAAFPERVEREYLS